MSRSRKTDKARSAYKTSRELLACYNSHFPFSPRKPPENRYASERAYMQACIGDITAHTRLEKKLGGRRYGNVQRTYRAELKLKMRRIDRMKRRVAMTIEVRAAELAAAERNAADF